MNGYQSTSNLVKVENGYVPKDSQVLNGLKKLILSAIECTESVMLGR
jgi:hypothetical protein